MLRVSRTSRYLNNSMLHYHTIPLRVEIATTFGNSVIGVAMFFIVGRALCRIAPIERIGLRFENYRPHGLPGKRLRRILWYCHIRH
jgi:hypothetical protein